MWLRCPGWDSQNTAIHTLGTAFVVLAQEETNYFTLEATMETPSELIPTEQFTEAWQRNEDNMLEHARQSCPMIIPPKIGQAMRMVVIMVTLPPSPLSCA